MDSIFQLELYGLFSNLKKKKEKIWLLIDYLKRAKKFSTLTSAVMRRWWLLLFGSKCGNRLEWICQDVLGLFILFYGVFFHCSQKLNKQRLQETKCSRRNAQVDHTCKLNFAEIPKKKEDRWKQIWCTAVMHQLMRWLLLLLQQTFYETFPSKRIIFRMKRIFCYFHFKKLYLVIFSISLINRF